MLRLVTAALIALAALPVALTLVRTRRPELATPRWRSGCGCGRRWRVLAGVLIAGAAIAEIWLSLDKAGPWLFGVYGAAAAVAILGIRGVLPVVRRRAAARAAEAAKRRSPGSAVGKKTDEASAEETKDGDGPPPTRVRSRRRQTATGLGRPRRRSKALTRPRLTSLLRPPRRPKPEARRARRGGRAPPRTVRCATSARPARPPPAPSPKPGRRRHRRIGLESPTARPYAERVHNTPYRVVQWTTGNVGKSSVKAIAANPTLELVGCYAWSPDQGRPRRR